MVQTNHYTAVADLDKKQKELLRWPDMCCPSFFIINYYNFLVRILFNWPKYGNFTFFDQVVFVLELGAFPICSFLDCSQSSWSNYLVPLDLRNSLRTFSASHKCWVSIQPSGTTSFQVCALDVQEASPHLPSHCCQWQRLQFCSSHPAHSTQVPRFIFGMEHRCFKYRAIL